MAPETNTTMNDLLEYMKKSDENRKSELKAMENKLAADRAADRDEFAQNLASLTNTINEFVKSGVKDEIVTAVKPIEEKQNKLMDEQSELARRILEIEKKMESKDGEKENIGSVNLPETAQHSRPNSHSDPISQELNETLLRKSAIQAAKKILGFSEITPHHIQQAIAFHGLNPDDPDEAGACAVKDFLYYEMKVPEVEIKKITVVRTFRPARQPDSNRLYAEFSDESTTNLINKYVRNLQPGSNVDIWIPPSLYQRFRDFDSACYNIRSGPEKVKAKVKYGEDDFILIKKSPLCHSWSRVIPDILSPFDPNPPSYLNPSGSPPIGRNNRNNKRKTLSPIASPQRNKTHRGLADPDVVEEVSMNITNNDVPTNLETGSLNL